MTQLGEMLRQARDFKGATLRDAERATRISRNYLSALENEEFSVLPAPAYARGIVRNYAQYLGLDPATMVQKYEELTGVEHRSAELAPATRGLDIPSHWVPNFAIIAFMIVMSAVVFAWMYSAYFQPSESLATTTVGVPTVTPVSESILGLSSPQALITTQGGGVATATPPATTPTAEPTATAEPAPPTATPEPAPPVAAPDEPTEVVVEEPPADDVAVEEEPVEDVAEDETTTGAEVAGAHTLVVWVTAEVWVQVTSNGEVVLDTVLPEGSEQIISGDSFSVTSGNGSFVHVYVDGVEYGTLGEWDATFSYP